MMKRRPDFQQLPDAGAGAGLTRRDLLRGGVTSGFALCLPSLGAFAPRESATTLIIVNLLGGNDGLNTVVPLRLQRYHDRRPRLAIPADQTLSLDRGPRPSTALGLHPALRAAADLWSRGDAAIVQRVGYPGADFSHFASSDVWSRGTPIQPPPDVEDVGWIARLRDLHARDRFGVVGVRTGQLLDFRGGELPAVLLDAVDEFDFAIDRKYVANSRYRYQLLKKMLADREFGGKLGQARDALLEGYGGPTGALREAIENYRSNVTYPATGFGEALRDSAILLSADLSTRIVYLRTGDYDMHSGQLERHEAQLGALDAGLGAFAADLEQLGVWPRVVIAVISEFGRTISDNGSGTDHGSGSNVMLFGGGLRGGLYGPDLVEADLAGSSLPFAVDFRTVYWEILSRHLQMDPAAVFPDPPASTDALGFIG